MFPCSCLCQSKLHPTKLTLLLLLLTPTVCHVFAMCDSWRIAGLVGSEEGLHKALGLLSKVCL